MQLNHTNIGDVEYRNIPDFTGYRVGSDGSVWSCKRIGPPYGVCDTWRRLKVNQDGRNYSRVVLCSDGAVKKESRLVHRVVCEAFHGPCPAGKECRHIDGNKSNNSSDNLAWGTRRENEQDKLRHGTVACGNRHGTHTKPETRMRGERNGIAKLTASKVIEIRNLHARGMIYVDIAAIYGVTRTLISGIVRRKRWKHLT